MGIRETQYIGLKEGVREFLKKHQKGKSRRWGKTVGMFDEEIPLYEYELQGGEVLREVEQCSPWSSGPCIFLCLEKQFTGERIFQWTEEEINAYL